MKKEEMYKSVGLTDRESREGARVKQIIWRLGDLRGIIKENPEDYLDEEHSVFPNDYDDALEEAQDTLEKTLSPERSSDHRTDFIENLKMAQVHLMILREDIRYPLDKERQQLLDAAYQVIHHLSVLEMQDDVKKFMDEKEGK